VQVRKTRAGWNIQLDNAAWAELMTGLSIAIDVCDGRSATAIERERAARRSLLRKPGQMAFVWTLDLGEIEQEVRAALRKAA
jgi:hypothetical protein